MTDARMAAARVLLAVEQGQTTLAAELEKAREPIADARDRGLLVELATGTLRWRNELDAVIAAASRRAISSIEPRPRAVLRLGAYQLRHLERVPAHAIVHESVEIVRALGLPRAAGFVNAVLRAIVRRGPTINLPARPGLEATPDRWIRYLSTTLSHPAWLVDRWMTRYGREAAERWCQFNNTAPSVVVRPLGALTAAALLRRLRDEGAEAAPAAFVHDAISLAPGSLGRLPPELVNQVLIQDEGSQIVARAAGVRAGERVLDVCASPGGKTLVLAGDLEGAAPVAAPRLVAADRRPARVALLARTLRRAGVAVPVVALDALRPLPFLASFDCVLLDVPCSGLGTLRRDPDLKWSRQADDLPRLAADQRRMLSAAAEAVRPGGRLVYATCSSEPEENGEVVEAFLAADSRYSLAPVGPETRVPPDMVEAGGCLATLPFRDGLDAFFAAVLVRRAGT